LTLDHPNSNYRPSRCAIRSPVLRGHVVGTQTRSRGRVEAGGSVEDRGVASGAVGVELGARVADSGSGGATAAGAAGISATGGMRRHLTSAIRHRYSTRLSTAMIRHYVSRSADLFEPLRPGGRRVPEMHFTALFSYLHLTDRKIRSTLIVC